MENIVACNHVFKRYKKFAALDDIGFTIERPSIVGLIGKNGAGKTTLMRILAGQYLATSGDVFIHAEDPYVSAKTCINTVLIDDTMKFPMNLKLVQILDEFAYFYPDWDQAKALKLLEFFNLPLQRKHQKLSKGMKSTFNMIVGLSANCAITLMDEPTTGMDANVRKDFYKMILNEYHTNPRLIVISSHMVEEIEDLIEDVIVMKNGKIIEHCTADLLRTAAVKLIGKAEAIASFLTDKSVLSVKQEGENAEYLVRGTFTAEENAKLAELNIVQEFMSINDFCILLCEEKNKYDSIDSLYREENHETK